MPIEPGTRLGPYEVTAPIGKGGMGEVYKATDTRLGRIVAIKVLPADLASDPESRRYFEREAKTISTSLGGRGRPPPSRNTVAGPCTPSSARRTAPSPR